MEVGQHLVHIGGGVAAAGGNPAPAGGLGGEQLGLVALGFGHRADHGLDFFELLLPLLEHAVVDLVHARDHFHQPPQGAHALDQTHLLQEIGEVEGGFLQLLLHPLHIGQFHLFLGLLHQGEHVAHAEDAAGHPFGVEGLQRLHLFAGADELDRRTAHLADREGGAPPGIAIELGEHGTGDAHLLMEGPGEIGGFLANHGIHHQQHLVGGCGFADPHHLLHHRLIDLEPAGGVHQHGVEALCLGLGNAGSSNGFGFGIGPEAEHLHPDLAAQGGQLVDGRGAINVGGDHQGPAALLLEVEAKFGGGRGFAGSLQARHQHHRGAFAFPFGLGEGGVFAAHGLHQLLVHQLDEFLVGADAPHHFCPHGLAAHLFDKLLHHRQADVGFQ